MGNLNKVILMGNLTRDPEMRYSSGGLAICKFAIAVNRSWKDANTGEKKEECAFIDIDSFGKTAEAIGKYFKKANPIFLEGRLSFQQWTDKQSGAKRSKLAVIAESFQFLGSKSNQDSRPPSASHQDSQNASNGGSGQATAPAAAPTAAPAQNGAPEGAGEDSVPF